MIAYNADLFFPAFVAQCSPSDHVAMQARARVADAGFIERVAGPPSR